MSEGRDMIVISAKLMHKNGKGCNEMVGIIDTGASDMISISETHI